MDENLQVITDVPPNTEYCVVRVDQLEHLVKEVNRLMGEGWKAVGGISFSQVQDNQFSAPKSIACQAMIREKKT